MKGESDCARKNQTGKEDMWKGKATITRKLTYVSTINDDGGDVFGQTRTGLKESERIEF